MSSRLKQRDFVGLSIFLNPAIVEEGKLGENKMDRLLKLGKLGIEKLSRDEARSLLSSLGYKTLGDKYTCRASKKLVVKELKRIYDEAKSRQGDLDTDHYAVVNKLQKSEENLLDTAIQQYGLISSSKKTDLSDKALEIMLSEMGKLLGQKIQSKYPDEKSFATRVWAAGKLGNDFKRSVIKTLPENEVEDFTKDFLSIRRSLFYVIKDDVIKRSLVNAEKRENRSVNRAKVNLNKLYLHFKSVLKSTVDPECQPDWKDVLLAIMFMTGRRPYSELCVGTTEFALSDKGEYFISVTGIAKARSAKSIEIPCLCPSKYVLSGWEYLKKSESTHGNKIVVSLDEYPGLDIYQIRERQERRFAAQINKYYRSDILPLVDIEMITGEVKLMSCYSLRAFFSMLTEYLFYVGDVKGEISRAGYRKLALGHSDNGDYSVQTVYDLDYFLDENNVDIDIFDW